MAVDDSDDADGPAVFPIDVSGCIDTDHTKLSSSELMLWGLANLWEQGKEGGYTVRHGSRAVSDFGPSTRQRRQEHLRRERRNTGAAGNPSGEDGFSDAAGGAAPEDDHVLPANEDNFFEKAFPCLFPYGTGGIEACRRVAVGFASHIRWALQHHDRRFRKHETFPFVSFGIVQRRQALGSARVQMKRKDFERTARVISTITVEQLKEAQREEEAHQPISNPAVRLLRQHVHATSSRIHGSDQARYRLRSQIWSTAAVHGPPSVWCTININDCHDPTMQVLAGEAINLDDFIATLGPDKDERARNVAGDPYAASKFFHFMIETILQTLFGVTVTTHQVKTAMGVLGEVSAYFGTVECQNRGTLHLHMLLWLKNTPTADELTTLLATEEFRAKMVAYIRANMRAYLPGLESEESIKAIPRSKEFAYARPPNPSSATYESDLRLFELRLARTEQLHTCKVRRCIITNKHGRVACKRKAPFECARDDFVTEAGTWGPKRLYGFMNTWNPAILVNAKCNNDCKLLTNGSETRNISFYITSYVAKKQGKGFNMSAVLARGFLYNKEHPHPDYVADLRESQRLLLFRLVNNINREQEIAGPMVMSYLMGWGDVYRSHKYTPIYWSSFSRELTTAFGVFDARYVELAIGYIDGRC